LDKLIKIDYEYACDYIFERIQTEPNNELLLNRLDINRKTSKYIIDRLSKEPTNKQLTKFFTNTISVFAAYINKDILLKTLSLLLDAQPNNQDILKAMSSPFMQ
jgi:hypothetical protein